MKHSFRLMVAALLLGGVIGGAQAAHENAKRDANRNPVLLGVTTGGEIRMVRVTDDGRIELASDVLVGFSPGFSDTQTGTLMFGLSMESLPIGGAFLIPSLYGSPIIDGMTNDVGHPRGGFMRAIGYGLVYTATSWDRWHGGVYYGATGAKVGAAADVRSTGFSAVVGATIFDASAAGGQTQVLLPAGTNYFSVRAAAMTTTQTGFLNYNDEPSSAGTGIFFNPARPEIKRENLSVGNTGTTLNISSGGPDTIPTSVDWGGPSP